MIHRIPQAGFHDLIKIATSEPRLLKASALIRQTIARNCNTHAFAELTKLAHLLFSSLLILSEFLSRASKRRIITTVVMMPSKLQVLIVIVQVERTFRIDADNLP